MFLMFSLAQVATRFATSSQVATSLLALVPKSLLRASTIKIFLNRVSFSSPVQWCWSAKSKPPTTSTPSRLPSQRPRSRWIVSIPSPPPTSFLFTSIPTTPRSSPVLPRLLFSPLRKVLPSPITQLASSFLKH